MRYIQSFVKIKPFIDSDAMQLKSWLVLETQVDCIGSRFKVAAIADVSTYMKNSYQYFH